MKYMTLYLVRNWLKWLCVILGHRWKHVTSWTEDAKGRRAASLPVRPLDELTGDYTGLHGFKVEVYKCKRCGMIREDRIGLRRKPKPISIRH